MMVNYQLDNAIHSLNNWSQIYSSCLGQGASCICLAYKYSQVLRDKGSLLDQIPRARLGIGVDHIDELDLQVF